LTATTGGSSEAELEIEKFKSASDFLPPNSILQIAERLRDTCAQMRRDQVEISFIRRMFDMSFADYSKLILTSTSNDVAKDMFNRILNFKWNLELLLAGVEGQRARLFWINEESVNGARDLSYRAIGSGYIQATSSIARRGHDASKSVVETIYTLYEAKRAAEMVDGVGPATDIAVVRPGQEPEFSTPEAIDILKSVYERLRPPSLSREDSASIEQAFSSTRLPPSQVVPESSTGDQLGQRPWPGSAP
jgi:hypothetical protein